MQVEWVIGVDPDSERYGVALYHNGKIMELLMLDHYGLVTLIANHNGPALNGVSSVLVSIENVMANNFVYARNSSSQSRSMAKIGMSIGRCQHSQKVLMEWLDKLEVPYVLHAPQKGNWAKDRPMFERVTGWAKNSNEDTRAAAFFGYLALKKQNNG